MLGVFDSGTGGLFALERLRELSPASDVCYLADAANLPYGEKAPEEIRQCLQGVLRFFEKKSVSALLLACGTASAVALPHLKGTPFPVFGVIAPAALQAANATKNRRIGILATRASVESGAYEQALRGISPAIRPTACAAPALVTAAEQSTPPSADELRAIVAPFSEAECDTVILGCTHFARFSRELSLALPGVSLVDCGRCAAEYFFRQVSPPPEGGAVTVYTTGDPRSFRVPHQKKPLPEPRHAPIWEAIKK